MPTTHNPLRLTRTARRLRPDPKRVITRLFQPTDPNDAVFATCYRNSPSRVQRQRARPAGGLHRSKPRALPLLEIVKNNPPVLNTQQVASVPGQIESHHAVE